VSRDFLTMADVLWMHAEMMRMLESGTFDVAHLEPWLRGFARADA